jgi:hypothetical protein
VTLLPIVQVAGADVWHAPLRHVSPIVHVSPSLHCVPSGAFASAGQVRAVPEQTSLASQSVAAARHVVPAGLAEQVPTAPGELQTPHPPLQALSQQTPSAQKPVAHCAFDVHDAANETSNATVPFVGVEPLVPPVSRTVLLPSSVADWP